MTQSLKTLIPLSLGVLVLLGYSYLGAQAPSNPPSNNADAPINTSGTYQAKVGSLGVVSLRSGQLCDASGVNCVLSIHATSSNTDLELRSSEPTLEFNDTDSVNATTDYWLHNNSNIFYIFADRNDDGVWTGESAWPMEISASTTPGGDWVRFANDVRATEFCERDGTDCFTAADITTLSTPLDTSGFLNTGNTTQTKTGNLVFSNTAPALKLADTDHRSVWLYNNSDNFYVLANRNADESNWETPHPLTIHIDNNSANDYASFSNDVRAASYCNAGGGKCITPGTVKCTTVNDKITYSVPFTGTSLVNCAWNNFSCMANYCTNNGWDNAGYHAAAINTGSAQLSVFSCEKVVARNVCITIEN